MTAYLVVHRLEITDPEQLKKYRDGIQETLDAFDGRVLARTDDFEVLEGLWHSGRRDDDDFPERVTVIEFPDRQRLKEWYMSDEYSPLRLIRQASARCDMVVVGE